MAYRGDQQQNRESLLSARHDEPRGVLLAANAKRRTCGICVRKRQCADSILENPNIALYFRGKKGMSQAD